jgi:hypothetical protein
MPAPKGSPVEEPALGRSPEVLEVLASGPEESWDMESDQGW